MKSQAIYTTNTTTVNNQSIVDAILCTRLVLSVTSFVGTILGERVTPRQALMYLHTGLSFCAFLLLAGNGIIVTALALIWFALSVFQCLRSGICNSHN